ncbi:MAG: AraC family transcriptional regulator [Agathobacter sp.]|nr:AraC family transcriptional regulator [Agathobacter sp.]
MYRELKENRPHGTKAYPYTQYFMHNPKRAFHIPVHWHDEVEIIYIKKGNITIYIGEDSFPAMAGDLFFVNSGELHFMESDDMGVEYYTLLFPLTFLSFQIEDALEQEVFLPLRQKKLLLPIRLKEFEAEKQMTNMVREVIMVNEEKETGYQLRTRILLLELIESFLKEDGFRQVNNTSSTAMQRELLAYIQEHYTEKITLAMLAQEFHLSEKYISWYFKEHFAISFMQYVSHLRMTRAKDLLLTTERSITEIALSCGYPSVNFFIRSFKEGEGITPLQYRKRTNTFL